MAKPRHKRRMRNYLLDRSFQLKYAGLLFAVAAVLSTALGFLLWRESQLLIAQSKTTVETGQRAVEMGKQATAESRKVTEVVRMNIKKDPIYADNPELLEELQEEQKKEDAKMLAQEKELEDKAAALSQSAAEIERQQQTMMLGLFGVLALLTVLLGLAGIVVTHKVAGPIFKMKRQITTLGDGDWRMPAPLRKGDELAEFFGTFEDAVKKMRAQRDEELTTLEKAIEDEDFDALRELHGKMGEVLSKS